jgi:hypothetical protein
MIVVESRAVVVARGGWVRMYIQSRIARELAEV